MEDLLPIAKIAAIIVVITAVASAIIDRKRSSGSRVFVTIGAIIIGACITMITQLVKIEASSLGDFGFLGSLGLIPSCWIIAFYLSPIIGGLIAIAPSNIFVRREFSSMSVDIIVAGITFLIGLFLFSPGGCF